MISKNGFPICSSNIRINNQWSSTGPDNLEFLNGHLIFSNAGITTAGNIPQGHTSLPFDPTNPVPWNETTPAEIIALWPNPEAALRDILGIIYESDKHQYTLGTKEKPTEPETSGTDT